MIQATRNYYSPPLVGVGEDTVLWTVLYVRRCVYVCMYCAGGGGIRAVQALFYKQMHILLSLAQTKE